MPDARARAARYTALLNYSTRYAATIDLGAPDTSVQLAALRFLGGLRVAQTSPHPERVRATARERFIGAFGYRPTADEVLGLLARSVPVPRAVAEVVRACWAAVALGAPVHPAQAVALPFAGFLARRAPDGSGTG